MHVARHTLDIHWINKESIEVLILYNLKTICEKNNNALCINLILVKPDLYIKHIYAIIYGVLLIQIELLRWLHV